MRFTLGVVLAVGAAGLMLGVSATLLSYIIFGG